MTELLQEKVLESKQTTSKNLQERVLTATEKLEKFLTIASSLKTEDSQAFLSYSVEGLLQKLPLSESQHYRSEFRKINYKF